MHWIEVIAELLNRVAEIIERIWYAQRQQQRQEEADMAHDDPSSAFADHFGGSVHHMPDASETDKTTD